MTIYEIIKIKTMENNNKLIAEFMGISIDGDFAYIEDEGSPLEEVFFINSPLEEVMPINKLNYHTSWDWLMPVIEKIESLGYTFEKNYQRVDKDWQSLIVKGNDILYQEFNKNSLQCSYYVVVEFIKENNKYICGSCGDNCNEYTYNEETDVDECNQCKTINQNNEREQ